MLTFEVQGIPAPKGSTRSFRHNRTGQVVTTGDNPNTRPWQAAVGWCAAAAMKGAEPTLGAVAVEVVFRFPRPKSHYRKSGELKPKAPARHTTKPDLDKLTRALFDALTGIVWRDDSQAFTVQATKDYAGFPCHPGAVVVVTEVPPPRFLGGTP
ncbi:MAG: RusA family crossover junction endodeoxyribonuclease [Candidatus Thermoplasmatota archaeon]|jgi:crossover junction endodeoxyribonuclease RusA